MADTKNDISFSQKEDFYFMGREHYIPRFYLKRWVKKDKSQLFSLSFDVYENFKKIDWQPKAPKSIGCKEDLYQEQEVLFFKPLDDKVSKILNKLDGCKFELNKSISLTTKERDDWSIYISAQFFRTPTMINEVHTYFKDNPEFKKIMEKWGFDSKKEDKLIREQIKNIICNPKVVIDLNKLKWQFIKVKSNKEIITCDNPLIFEPRRLDSKECIMLLPLNPDSFALGVNNLQHEIFRRSNSDIVKFINIKMIQNARKSIFARSKYSIGDNFLKNNL